MIPVPTGVRIWIATGHTDMRKGMQGLSLLVQESLGRDPFELSPKVGDGGNREGGISWGCLTPPLLHRRSDMPCPTITSSI